MNTDNLGLLLSHFGSHGLYSILAGAATPRMDLSIEGMRGQQFSVGVFVFMLIGVFVFSGIIYSVAFGRFAPKTMKKGEKLMIGAIILGTILAVVFGGMQLLSGDLF